jgi:hypothetical protein
VRHFHSTPHRRLDPEQLSPKTELRLLFLFSPLLFVLFHDCASGDFFCSFAVASRTLGALFNMLILPLLFLCSASQMFLTWHALPPFLVSLLYFAGRTVTGSSFWPRQSIIVCMSIRSVRQRLKRHTESHIMDRGTPTRSVGRAVIKARQGKHSGDFGKRAGVSEAHQGLILGITVRIRCRMLRRKCPNAPSAGKIIAHQSISRASTGPLPALNLWTMASGLPIAPDVPRTVIAIG